MGNMALLGFQGMGDGDGLDKTSQVAWLAN